MGVLVFKSRVSVGFIVLVLWLVATVYAGDGDIVISEVGYNATCKGTVDNICGTSGTSETHFEWVEIYNKGTAIVNVGSWQICDNTACDSLPNQDISPGEYWIIAHNATALQTEFNQYTPSFTVDSNRTISLNSPIGSGLNNSTGDVVYLLNSSGVTVDCVSWASTAGTACSSRTYVSGGGGSDTNLNNAQDGQSIANIQGSWYKHGPSDASEQASPYQSNTATGGSPTAITLFSLTACGGQTAYLSEHVWVALFSRPTAALAGLAFILAAAGLTILKRRRPS